MWCINVAEAKTTLEMMSILSDMCNKVQLMTKLFNLKMGEDILVAGHINEFNTIISRLTSVEINFDDEILTIILLASLPNTWKSMRATVNNSVGKGKLRFNDDRDQILVEEVL